MPEFEGKVSLVFPYVIEADDQEMAEFDMISLAKDDFPEANNFDIVSIQKVN